jgi:iron-sulfur cluster repair protein YtfE (RIC family)
MITKEMTVSDILREKPSSTQLLMSYGICNCCGGELTLEESASSKGVDVKKLLERINNKP